MIQNNPIGAGAPVQFLGSDIGSSGFMPKGDMTGSQAFDIAGLPTEDGRTIGVVASDVFIQFATESVVDPVASADAGRVIYVDVEVAVVSRATGTTTPDTQRYSSTSPAEWNSLLQAYPNHYRQWRASQDTGGEAVVGTPLREWPMITRAQAETFAAMRLYSVEQLATVSDQALQNMGMGAYEIRKSAQDWLTAAEASAGDVDTARQLRETKEANEAMAKQLAELKAQLLATQSMVQSAQSVMMVPQAQVAPAASEGAAPEPDVELTDLQRKLASAQPHLAPETVTQAGDEEKGQGQKGKRNGRNGGGQIKPAE